MAKRSVNDGNVTYVNFGARKKVSTPEEVLRVDHASSVLNPAATRLVAAMSRNVDSGRLSRGRDYARSGNVVSLEVRNGAAHGRVAGSQNEPFAVLIRLPYRSNDQLGQVAEIMARTPNALRNSRSGEVPEEVLDLLLGDAPSDISFSCNCPDAAPVCKHIVAVVEKLAAQMDADGSVVFALRGLSFAALEQVMIAKARDAAQDAFSPDSGLSTEERNELFWSGRNLPDLPEPKVAPAIDDSDRDLLRKALRAVCHTNIELLRAVSDVEELYEYLTRD